jgi:hypothetical protein
MSTQTQRLLVITAAAAAVPGGLFAQPKPSSDDREQQLLEQIADLHTEGGPTPKELAEPLRALALLYEETDQPVAAIAVLEEARHVTRVHQGLASADEALLLRQQVRNEKAIGLHERAWDLEQDMVTIARQHHEDARMLPIFRELADDRLMAIEQVRASERPPMIYAGCYNGAPLPPYDYTRAGQWRDSMEGSGGFSTPSCYGGINQDLVAKLSREVLMYYADAIETILRTGDYASQELRELERAGVRLRNGRLGSMQLGKGGGSFYLCRGGTLDYFLELEILDSCLAPVGRGQGLVVANVGNPPALLRLIKYEIRSEAPATARASAIAELADWYVLFTPAERRRFNLPQVTFSLYEWAYRELEQSGDLEASTALFAPELPVTLPTYEPDPLASAAESPRYIDVSFAVTKYGSGERVELVTINGATRAEKQDLVRLIETTTFRPRMVNGKIAEETPVTLRYYLR